MLGSQDRSTARPSRTLLRKSEALEKGVTVTLRAESVASTKADFFKTTDKRKRRST